MTRVVMIVQGVVLEGNLPEGMSPEALIQSGQTLELGRVKFVGMAVKIVPTMQVKTADIGAIALTPVEGLELGPVRREPFSKQRS